MFLAYSRSVKICMLPLPDKKNLHKINYKKKSYEF